MEPVLLIHGGAGSRQGGHARNRALFDSLSGILGKVYPSLRRGRSALDTVTFAVKMLEDDPLYNAGRGSKIQSDGRIRMSASIMDGNRRRFGGCVNVERVKNPIGLARALLSRKDRVLAGKGAEAFARSQNMAFASPYTRERRAEFRRRRPGKTGTVGAIALDCQGRLAAATSTGGRGFEFPGRVSDTPTVAACFSNRFCALSATGVGEEIVEFGVAAAICTQVEMGRGLASAAGRLLAQAKSARAQFGLIALDRQGHFYASTTTPHLIWAIARLGRHDIHP